MLDHIILAEDSYFSFADEGIIYYKALRGFLGRAIQTVDTMVSASHSKYIGDRQSSFHLFNFERMKRIVKLKTSQQTKENLEKKLVRMRSIFICFVTEWMNGTI